MYLVYGNDIFAHEAIYSIASAFSFDKAKSDIRFIVYTDRPGLFSQIDVEIVSLDAQQMAEWIGPAGYHHRMKMLAFSDALRRFEGCVAFVDTDTYFLKSPLLLFARIAPGRSVLHLPEGRLSEIDEPGYTALDDIMRSGLPADGDTKPIPSKRAEIMWNSGVIGLHASDQDGILRTIALMDRIKTLPGSDVIKQLEQFALGYVLSRETEIRCCDDVVFHYWYWDLKDPFREMLPAIVRRREPWTTVRRYRPRTSPVRKAKMLMRILLRRLGFTVPGFRGSI